MPNNANSRVDVLSRLATWLGAGMLLLVPFYAFLTVWLSSLFGHYTVLRLWPEATMVVIFICAAVTGTLQELVAKLKRMHLLWPMTLYLGLLIVSGVYSLTIGHVGYRATGYGLLVDGRPVLWFITAFAVANFGLIRRTWQPILLVSLGLVSIFALMQFFVLPTDFLAHFGYVKESTVAPIQTINQDTSTIRAQSFLRGPNPLGAYLLLGIGLLAIIRLKRRYKLTFMVLSAVALIVTFSRSAWLGMVITGIAWLGASRGFVKDRRQILFAMLAVLAVLVASVATLSANQAAKNAFLHVNDHSTARQTSNEDRLAALRSGMHDVLREPFGRGLGTAGPASVYNHAGSSRNSENYFLLLGQELGWLGLGLFIAICYRMARTLYERKDPLSHMLFATFAGLTFVNLLSYAWADVTLTYLWWGLAAISLSVAAEQSAKKQQSA